eukprot:scaffold1659_cov33-Phaeocystis_antarctica.AAC.3
MPWMYAARWVLTWWYPGCPTIPQESKSPRQLCACRLRTYAASLSNGTCSPTSSERTQSARGSDRFSKVRSAKDTKPRVACRESPAPSYPR